MPKTYRIGFTRAALINETVLVAKEYCDALSWEDVKRRVSSNNLLQARTLTSGNRLLSEIAQRLVLLNDAQIELIAADYASDVRQLIWIALCKKHPFIADFTSEVLLPLHARGRFEITYDDYDYFFNAKADWHPELDKSSDKSRRNARQTLFLMLHQCDILSDSNQLIPQMISSAVQNCSSESDLAFIPGAIRL